MAEEKFRLPKSSYEEIVKIVKGYAQFEAESSLDDVSRQTMLHKTAISRNVGFLVDAGILQGGRNKECTPYGRELAQALLHEMPDEIRRLWRTIVRETEFLSRILGAVTIRNGMDEGTIKSHIAYSAGEKKNAGVMRGARCVVDILRAAELLREEDGKLTAVDVKTVDVPSKVKENPVDQIPPIAPSTPLKRSEINHRLPDTVAAGVNVNITINIECAASEIARLGSQLKQLLRDISDKDNIDHEQTDDTEGES